MDVAAGHRMPGRGRATPAIVFAVAFVAYLPALWTGFTADDFFILARLKEFGGLSHPLSYFTATGFFEYYRPLTFLVHAVDWQIWGLNPAGFHLTNLLLHGTSSVLVFMLGRRLDGPTTGLVAALLFALHPASHEAVYWVSARFDLLATCLTLTSLLLLTGPPPAYVAGVVVFGLALLSKESALALPVMFLAYEVLIRRVGVLVAIRRLVPIALMAAAYAVLRSQAGALEAAGGASRLPKLAMLAAMAAGLFWIAVLRRPSRNARAVAVRDRAVTGAILAMGAVSIALLFVPATSLWLREKTGFVSFALSYSISPIVVPAPAPSFFDRPSSAVAAVELAIVIVCLLAAWRSRRWFASRPAALFALVFCAAALAPVSSMTSGPRYLYLASAGVAVLIALALGAGRWALDASRSATSVGRLALAVLLFVSVVQLFMVARAWKWAGDMTHEALALVSSTLPPCGTRDVIVLTTPVGIRGVFSNLNEVAFDVLGCKPASYVTVLRVMNTDAHVDAVRRGDTIELRVPAYQGNFVTASDLRHFDRSLPADQPVTIDLPIGRLRSTGDRGAQIFELGLAESARSAQIFFYSDGRLRAL
jgi:hypothetical protein